MKVSFWFALQKDLTIFFDFLIGTWRGEIDQNEDLATTGATTAARDVQGAPAFDDVGTSTTSTGGQGAGRFIEGRQSCC